MRIRILSLYTIAVIALIDIARTTSFNTQYWLVAIAMIMFLRYLITKKRISSHVIFLFVAWILINVFSSFFFGLNLKYELTIRYGITYILFSWVIMDTYGKKFFDVFESIIYAFTFVSLPLYLANFFFKAQFDQLSSFFEIITNPILLDNPNYWSSIIYVNAISQYYGNIELLRNNGFMWEPGYFALIIIFALGYRWLNNGIKFDMPFYIYLTAIITTFSTAGYLAIFVLISAYFFKKSSLSSTILFVVASLLFFYYVYSLDFMSGKIDVYVGALAADQFNYDTYYESVKLNRFQIALYDISRVFRYPFGFGLNDRVSFENVDVVGTNGLSGLLRMWGIPLFLYFAKLLYKYHELQNGSVLSRNSKVLIFISLLIVFFSQSIHYSLLPYLIIFSTLHKIQESKLS